MTAPSAYEFDVDSRFDVVAPDRYSATVTDRWHALGGGPNGGYLMSMCLRALKQEMPFPDVLVSSAFFLRLAVPGPAEVHTEVVRAGRRVATGQAMLVQEGKERLRVTATFGTLDQAEGRTLVADGPPALPGPDECVDPLGGKPLEGVSITERLEFRFAEMPAWWQGTPSDQASMEFWMRFRDGRQADLDALPMLLDAAPPAVLAIGEFASSTLELTAHLLGRPAPGWLACRATTRHLINGYHEEDFEIWDSAGALVAQGRQFALLP